MGSNYNVGLTLDNEEEDIELDLGLSIGSRSYKRTKENGLIHDQKNFLQRSSSFNSGHLHDVGPREKREIQALRRQEAKRKREEEKQRVKKRGVFCENGEEVSNGRLNANGCGGFGGLNAWTGWVTGGSEVDGGSPASTSPAGSDRRRSPSLEAGNGSDTKRNLSQSTFDQPQLTGSKDDSKKEHECSATSQQVVASAAHEQTNHISDTIPSYASSSEKCSDFPEKHVTKATNSAPGLMKLCNGIKGKHPKPQTQNHLASSLSHMPCVSTTGNGPDGRTVKGFLYRYSKTEVNIMCVCHGASFSPAEFVQHAGGTDITHPLRHIIMIPSSY